MNAIIIDDESANIENLNNLLGKYCKQINVVGSADNISDAAFLTQDLQPDLLFLDIQMGKNTGFDLLNMLPDRNFEVIFVTAFDHYGIQAVKFAALDYLLKPVDIDELKTAVGKAEKRISAQKNHSKLDFLLDFIQNKEPRELKIALPQVDEIRYVRVQEIIRCKAENTYTCFYLSNNEKILVSKPLKVYADLLKEYGFLRTHQSHLVNPDFIKSLLKEDGGSVLLTEGSRIPISRSHKEHIKRALRG